jgi:hypothetical protein
MEKRAAVIDYEVACPAAGKFPAGTLWRSIYNRL